jgi:hypothetical protein
MVARPAHSSQHMSSGPEPIKAYSDGVISELIRLPADARLSTIIEAMRHMLSLYDAQQIDPGSIGTFMDGGFNRSTQHLDQRGDA